MGRCSARRPARRRITFRARADYPSAKRLLGLTPISAFRPRRWRGALLPDDVQLRFEVLSRSTAHFRHRGFTEARHVSAVEVLRNPEASAICF